MMEEELGAVSSSQESLGTVLDRNLPASFLGDWPQHETGHTEDGPGDRCRSDFGLAAAEEAARASGSLTPLIKQELKWLVHSRRLTQGKEELTVEFNDPPSRQLTQAEEDRRRRRKEQNKQAARRFRQKQKCRETTVLGELTRLQDKNGRLRDELTQLQRVKDHLVTRLTAHTHPLSHPRTHPAPAPSLLSTPPSPPYPFALTTPSPFPYTGPAPVASRDEQSVSPPWMPVP